MAIRKTLSARLAAAMRRRDAGVVTALRAALSAVANAEAAPPAEPLAPAAASQHFAGASPGLGVTEVARAELTDDQVRAIVAHEHADLLEHAERLAGMGRAEEAAAARRGADALAEVLAGSLGEPIAAALGDPHQAVDARAPRTGSG